MKPWKTACLACLPALLLISGGCTNSHIAKSKTKTTGVKTITEEAPKEPTSAKQAAEISAEKESVETPKPEVSTEEPSEQKLGEAQESEDKSTETSEIPETNESADDPVQAGIDREEKSPPQADKQQNSEKAVATIADEPAETKDDDADNSEASEQSNTPTLTQASPTQTDDGKKEKPSKPEKDKEATAPAVAKADLQVAPPPVKRKIRTLTYTTDNYEDIWARLRCGFVLPGKDRKQSLNWAKRFAAHRNDIDDILSRAESYLWHITTAVEARGMPMELALIPAVESGFDPYALSHGSASGLWQFVPATAKRFGLRENWWYDGRRDLDDSTAAALDYLEYLHGMFDDWLLALAAYNAGEGRVQRAISRNKKNDLPTDFWQLKLPAETRGYVPKLLGLAALIEQPKKYAFVLPTAMDEPRTAAVQLPGQINMVLAAELADMEIEDLQELNPGFQQWATHPDGPHRLYLPVDKLVGFHERLTNTAPEKLVTWRRQKVAAGDTLSKVAARNRVDVEVLRQANSLRSERLRTGDYLLVPAAVPGLRTEEMLLVARQIAEMRGVGGGFAQHSVRAGDTLWDIARLYDVSLSDLLQENGWLSRKATLKPGQVLDIPAGGGEGAVMQKTAASDSASQSKHAVFYKVRNGDTLGAIAQRFGVRLKHLLSWNGLSRRNPIHPGQTLKILVPQGTFTTET